MTNGTYGPGLAAVVFLSASDPFAIGLLVRRVRQDGTDYWRSPEVRAYLHL